MKQFLIALDQLLNCLVWSQAEGQGTADETLSARAWRLGTRYPTTWGRFEYLVDGFFRLVFRQPDHCFESYLAERDRKQLPKEYRNA